MFMEMNFLEFHKFFLPMSLRVEDSSVERSTDSEVVDFIFTKDVSVSIYDNLFVKDDNR